MGGVSIWHWVVVGIVVMLLFGRGKVSELMGDVAKGIKAFKKGMSEEEVQAAEAAKPMETAKTIDASKADAGADTVKTEKAKKV
jgi:sec-independent protein translocase protein TatA